MTLAGLIRQAVLALALATLPAAQAQQVAAPEEPQQAAPESLEDMPEDAIPFDEPAAALEAPVHDPGRGPVTNLPLPRYVSLKGKDGNARRGPSLEHRIDWVFRHPGMPLKVTAEFENWRRVEDRDGMGGWVHYTLLSGVRTVIIDQDLAQLRQSPAEGAMVVAQAELGAIARLGACTADWCRVTASGAKGWLPKSLLWGVEADEVRE